MVTNFENLTGQKFGKLMVISRAKDYISSNGERRVAWNCQCECGNKCIVLAKQLKNNKTKSCGCLKHIKKPQKNLVGLKFNKLLVIEYLSNSKYLCQCECGQIIKVSSNDLKKGHTKSCGCYKLDVSKNNHLKIHGISSTRIYKIWKNIKTRSYNVNASQYSNYGARGIKICDEWLNPLVFYDWAIANGYSDNLTIDRIDVNGNYEPSNCRWISLNAQQRNRTTSRLITFNNITHSVIEWAEIFNINRKTLIGRLNANWDVEKALTTPPRPLAKYSLKKVK